MSNEEMELLNLMAADTSATRLFYVYNLLEKLVFAQRRSMQDILFGGGFVSVFNLLAVFNFPEGSPYFVLLSLILIGIVGYYWWDKRKQKDLEALETITQISISLDSARRYYRHLQIATDLETSNETHKLLIKQTRGNLKGTVQILKRLTDNIGDAELSALGEVSKEDIKKEIELWDSIIEKSK